MTDNKKRGAFALAILFLLLFLLSSCKEATVYADGIACHALMSTAIEAAPVSYGYGEYGAEHLRYNLEDTSLPDDFCIFYSKRSEDINEVGILHTADSAAREELCALLERYLETSLRENEAFIASYAPEELPKLREAEVRVFGSYAVYAILSADQRRAFFGAIEELLAAK